MTVRANERETLVAIVEEAVTPRRGGSNEGPLSTTRH